MSRNVKSKSKTLKTISIFAVVAIIVSCVVIVMYSSNKGDEKVSAEGDGEIISTNTTHTSETVSDTNKTNQTNQTNQTKTNVTTISLEKPPFID